MFWENNTGHLNNSFVDKRVIANTLKVGVIKYHLIINSNGNAINQNT